MAAQQGKALNVFLWVAQLLLAATLVWAACMKLFQPAAKLAAMWPWTGQVPAGLVKFTALVDMLGAAGLVLPGLLKIQPRLTPIAAIGVIVLMVCAMVFHVSRGEGNVIGVNIVFAIMAAFVVWGRWRG